ncbi:MAG: response regulator [Gammaproteobacteria bacterium]|nr:response regulator [Gammaproteobacteria bacterium]
MSNLDKKIVLIVDDTAANITLLNNLLRTKYKIRAAPSGERALELAHKEPRPDLILLDVMMPEMDGFEVCRQLKTDPETAQIPVIFVTGKDDAKDEQEGMSLGAVGYLQKPINLKLVLELLEQQLASRA